MHREWKALSISGQMKAFQRSEDEKGFISPDSEVALDPEQGSLQLENHNLYHKNLEFP